MSWADRVLARIGLQRPSAVPPRRRRVFAGARVDRLTQDFFSGTTSGSGELRLDLRRLRNRSRTMVRDSAVAKRYCALFEENVVGEAGIQLKPSALLSDGNPDRRINDLVGEAFARWSEPVHCTVDGRLGFVDLQHMLVRLEPMDGEVLLRLVDGEGTFGFAVQVLDPDQLDETLNVEPAGGGPWIRQGVELSPRGRPVAYHIWDGHPQDQRRGQRRAIPAEDVIHLYLPWRPGAARGVPWLHAALQNVNMLEGYLEAALVAARVGASTMGAITGLEDDEDEQTEVPVEADPGKFFRLGKDQSVEMFDPKQPTTAFSDFYKACVRAIAQAGGVAYTSLSGDLEAVNYSSIRAGLLAERDRYKMLQQRLIQHALQRIYRRWLRMAVLTQALPITAADARRAERVHWQPRGFPWVDPQRDIDALQAEIALGLHSRTDAAAERGRDLEKTLEKLDAEQRLAKEYGVDISGIPVGPGTRPTAAESDTATKPARALRIPYAS